MLRGRNRKKKKITVMYTRSSIRTAVRTPYRNQGPPSLPSLTSLPSRSETAALQKQERSPE